MNERKLNNKEKSPKSRLHAAIVPQYVRFSWLICVWGSADPRPPNFAEIHARGRRGRLEYDHRDLIPPWGHGLLHSEAEKPTMAVWHDRYDGVFPSWLTAMTGKDNCKTAAHGGTMLDDRQPIQETFGESAAEKAVATVHNSCSPGTSRAEPCACMPGFRAKLSPGSALTRAAAGKE